MNLYFIIIYLQTFNTFYEYRFQALLYFLEKATFKLKKGEGRVTF